VRIVLLSEYPLSADRVVGGLEALSRGLAAAFTDRGHDVHVISFHLGLDGARVEETACGTIHRYPLPLRMGNVSFGAGERRLTRDTIRGLSPDVVHSLGLGPKALAAACAGVPWIVSVNGIQSNEAGVAGGWRNVVRGFVLRRMEQAGLDAAKDVIVPNPLVRAMVQQRLSGQRVHLIENQVDEGFFRIEGEGDPAAIVSIGRLIPLKAPEVLIDAGAQLAAEGRAFGIRFVGPADDPAYLDSLRARAEAAGIADRVAFLGFVSDDELLAELAHAGILAHSSRVEVAPLAVMQAMAAGRPVVATDVGSTAHLVVEDRTGHLVPRDRPGEMAAALARLLDDPGAARRLGAAGREQARERFLPGRVADRTLAVYEGLRQPGSTSEIGGSNSRNPLELHAVAPASPKPDGEA